MTGDLCLLCARNRTRRWIRRHNRALAIAGGTVFAACFITWVTLLACALTSLGAWRI